MKKPTLLLIIVTLLSQFSFAQSGNWNLAGFTPAEEVEILDDLSEAENLQKGELIFAKAKGVFSISPINTINNRALLKLKSEASMRGASHIYIDYRSIENSIFSKSSMYSAIIYKNKKVNIKDVQNAIDGKKLYVKQESKYNRNGWKASTNKKEELFDLIVNDVTEKNGKIILNLRTINYKSGNYTSGDQFEVIALEGNRMLVTKESLKNVSLVVLGIEIQ